MSRSKPIYVELEIDTDMDTLWEHTQVPSLHEQWDLRFSSIEYLPRATAEAPQSFLYETRIGFGLAIRGTGETRASLTRNGRLSTLAFGSEQPLSLIRRGAGYWRYEPLPEGRGITFATRFDYETRFGPLGRWLDRLLFRPLFGRATAWSFDALRIWVERRIPPAVTIRLTLLHYALVFLLGVLWVYQGLVPKLLYPEAGELALLQQTGIAAGFERLALTGLGCAQMLWGATTVVWHRRRWMYPGQALLILGLTLPALWRQPELLQLPFQPLTLALGMLGIGLGAGLTRRFVPRAGRCRRTERAAREERRGDDAIDLSASVR